MSEFIINANVPIEEHRLEHNIGRLAAFTSHIGRKVGEGALLAYSGMYDSINETHYRPELVELFKS